MTREFKCWVCGNKAERVRGHDDCINVLQPNKHERNYCKACYEKMLEKEREDDLLFIQLKAKRMFETAVSKLEKQHLDFYKYEEAIRTVEEYVQEKPEKFDSAYEIMAAIMLIHNHIKIKLQYQVDKYRLDFVLPVEKIVLEIDGYHHKHQQDRDGIKDFKVKRALGEDWQIVRIPTEVLDKDASKLIKAIDAIVDLRLGIQDEDL